MSNQITVPVLIALLAFLIADERNKLMQSLYDTALNLGNRKSVEVRLSQLGKHELEDYENFRISQVAYLVTLLGVVTTLFTLSFISWGQYFFLAISISFGVHAVTDRQLTRRVISRQRAVESEFPAIVEMLTLAVGAGESPAAALKRITQRAHGYLVQDFSRVVREVESGASFTTSLDELSRRLNSDSLRRFVDSLIISISRGTPLVETLTHSANESRNQERIRLLTAAGKSEISMMIPVVFLILPISILFALFPSLTNLNLFGS